jgi:hypothetical protein
MASRKGKEFHTIESFDNGLTIMKKISQRSDYEKRIGIRHSNPSKK